MCMAKIVSTAWNTSGSKIAVTCKDKKLRVLDSRDAHLQNMVTGASHDSVRASKVIWAGPDTLITTGFSRAAYREILLHRITGDSIEIIGRATIDISPAQLFPVYDIDTSILFVYSKGERTCHAYEVVPDAQDKSKVFIRLPSFEHGTLQTGWAFLTKHAVDVRKVEIAKAYRLTPSSVQLVTFSIPRAKEQFFQDDIYVPTLDLRKPLQTAQEWQSGKDPSLPFLDLRPSDMPLRKSAFWSTISC